MQWESVRSMLENVDVPPPPAQATQAIYHVKYTSPSELLSALQSLLPDVHARLAPRTFTPSVEKQYTLSLGMYGQYWLDGAWSVWAEYNPVLRGYQGVIAPGETGRSHDAVALGAALETGGHMFYLFLTNSTRLNPSQYLVGADRKVAADDLRLGFGITRYL